MKKTLFFPVFAACCLAISVSMAQTTITINSIPTTIEEFIQLRKQKATSPEGGAAMFCLAMKIYMDNEELGRKCFVAIADRSELKTGDTYKGYTLSSWMTIEMASGSYPLIANTYIGGSSPENGYTVSLPYKYTFTSGTYSGDPSTGKTKIFVACSGADSPRPIHMVKNDKGIWKASKWSSLYAGMKPVEEQIIDDL